MQPTATDLAIAVNRAAAERLAKAVEHIKHCVAQLSDEQVWWRPTDNMNSIGNLILHLSGNVRQWIVAGIGGAPDDRQRPREFSERGPIARAELLRRLDDVIAEARRALENASAQELLRQRSIQGFQVSGLDAIFDSVPHFVGHTQEIVQMTRTLLGDRYQFAWTPTTPEQGAP